MASASHLKPNEKGAITAKMSTAAKKGLTTETIEIISNDPKRIKVILTLQATIQDPLQPAAQPGICK
jgi:hypothetical protein